MSSVTRRKALSLLGGAAAIPLSNKANAWKLGKAAGTYNGIAATNGVVPSILTGVTSANTRSGHFARNTMSRLQVVCYNYYVSQIERAPGASMTITVVVEYPPNVFHPITTDVIPDGQTLFCPFTDLIMRIVANAERFWCRTFQQCSAGLVASSDGFEHSLCDFQFMADGWEAGSVDKTMGGEISPGSGNTSYHPTIIAEIPSNRPAVFIIGSSIPTGTRDTNDMSGDSGSVARSIGGSFGYFKGSRDGDFAADIAVGSTQRLLLKSYCSHAFVDCGTNDLFFGDFTAAQVKTSLSTIWGLLAPLPTYQLTVIPRTTSTNGWIDTTNQALINQATQPGLCTSSTTCEPGRLSVNADLRGGSFQPSAGIVDTAPIYEFTGGFWIANKTPDGVHPGLVPSTYLDIVAANVIVPSMLGPAEAVPAQTGSAWGDHGTNVTVSTFRRPNDSAIGPNTNTATTVRGLDGHSSGLLYAEVELIGLVEGVVYFGLLNATTGNGAGLDFNLGIIDDSFGIGSNNTGFAFVSGTIFMATAAGDFVTNAGDVFGLAIDFTNKFCYLARNNVWLNGGVPASGATGTGHVAFWSGTPTLFVGVTFNNVFYGGVRIRTVQTLYDPPSGGYTRWG